MRKRDSKRRFICILLIMGIAIVSLPSNLWSENIVIVPGEEGYNKGIEELDMLTTQEIFKLLAELGDMLPEEIALSEKIKKQLSGKELLKKEVLIQQQFDTWMGPIMYKYHFPENDPMLVTTVDLIPPIGQRKPREFTSSIMMNGGVVILDENGKYLDLLEGKQYFDLAFRILESSSEDIYSRIIGHEMVYLEPAKDFFGIIGFFFPVKWLGRAVYFCLVPPLSPTYYRKRLNPKTKEEEIVEYSAYHFVNRIVRQDSIIEITYDDKTGIEDSRKIYNNEGSITDPVKGALLESYRTKMFLFDKDPHKRKIEREKIAVIKEPAN
ncbi:MAG: hypothetical protein JRE64_22770 [Deltaproteobacteria bacterium]|nr:hypothetical protein [Deltaproteobacteria bacterium]